ncbi:hypothetical protein [Chryseobacterium taklimakanense]|nr:hypothetical protein [Chryseobacterium taklimakanense]
MDEGKILDINSFSSLNLPVKISYESADLFERNVITGYVLASGKTFLSE